MVFVSILIPLYNGIEFLEECIDSVIRQTFGDWELLIGINGHGDNGGEILKIAKKISEKDPRIQLFIQSPPLKGKVESLNDLVEKTNADWIAILDCDDKWEPTKLELQYQALQNIAKDADVIGTYCQYFGDIEHKLSTLPAGYINPSELEKHNPIINSSALIKKEYSRWEYNELNYTMEDYSLWMDICLKGGKLYNIPEYVTWHRIHRSSAFNSKGYSNEALRNKYIQLRNKI